jgi:N-acetyl-beta-hexosaminidase
LHRVYDYEPLERLKRLGLQADAVQRLRGVQANLWTETVESEERAQAGGRKLPGSWKNAIGHG